jgi:hypothetical protein
MQLSQILSMFAVVSLAIGTPLDGDKGLEGVEARDLVKRECYSGGKTWGDNRNHAIDRAGRWCSGSGGSGTYRAGQTKYGCYNALFGDNKYEFWIQRTGTTSASLSSPQCNEYMQEQIRNCDRGGQGERNGWYFR